MTAARKRSIAATVCALSSEGRSTAQIPDMCISLGAPSPGEKAFVTKMESDIRYLTRLGYAVYTSPGLRNKRRCSKATRGEKCRCQDHFLFLTLKGFNRFRKDMYAAFLKGVRRDHSEWKKVAASRGITLPPPATRRRFYEAVRHAVAEVEALPLV